MNPLEQLRQNLLAGKHNFGLPVTEATDIFGDSDYLVVMPPNTRSKEKQPEKLGKSVATKAKTTTKAANKVRDAKR